MSYQRRATIVAICTAAAILSLAAGITVAPALLAVSIVISAGTLIAIQFGMTRRH